MINILTNSKILLSLSEPTLFYTVYDGMKRRTKKIDVIIMITMGVTIYDNDQRDYHNDDADDDIDNPIIIKKFVMIIR